MAWLNVGIISLRTKLRLDGVQVHHLTIHEANSINMQHLAAPEALNPISCSRRRCIVFSDKTTKSHEFLTTFNYNHFCKNEIGGGNIQKCEHWWPHLPCATCHKTNWMLFKTIFWFKTFSIFKPCWMWKCALFFFFAQWSPKDELVKTNICQSRWPQCKQRGLPPQQIPEGDYCLPDYERWR